MSAEKEVATKRSILKDVWFAVVLLGLAPSCLNAVPEVQDPIDNRVKPPMAPGASEGIQFVMPEFVIPAGSEHMLCWVPDWVPSRDYFITRFEGYQGPGGHHVAAFSSTSPSKPGSKFDCTNLESMVSFSPLILPDPKEQSLLPEGFAVRLPKGSNIILQSHYINTTDQDLLVSDVARFDFFLDEREPVVASYLIVHNSELELAPGVGKASAECELETSYKLLLMFGHMHGSGTHMSVELQRRGVRETIYKIDSWHWRLRDLPLIKAFSLSDPFQLKAGDKLYLNCYYNNQTDHAVTFPEEMCVMVAYYYPALKTGARDTNGLVICG